MIRRGLSEAARLASCNLRVLIALVLLIAPVRGTALYGQALSSDFVGRWDLTMLDPAAPYPSWIEVKGAPGGQGVTVLLVGNVGSAHNLPTASVAHGLLTFTSPKEEEGGVARLYRANLRERELVGTMTQTGHPDVPWIGKPAPPLHQTSVKVWGKPQILFDGKTLTGWHPRTKNKGEWKIANGALSSIERGSDLASDNKFMNFKLHFEWRCGSKANSGVYLRGRYEVQIESDSAQEPGSHHTGGVYGFLAPVPEQPRRENVWQTFDITLIGRTLQVVQNGITVIDHRQIPGITGGALDSDEGAPGPILLQGSEDGVVEFRNIQISPEVR